jgi:hypothetical protein
MHLVAEALIAYAYACRPILVIQIAIDCSRKISRYHVPALHGDLKARIIGLKLEDIYGNPRTIFLIYFQIGLNQARVIQMEVFQGYAILEEDTVFVNTHQRFCDWLKTIGLQQVVGA